MQRTLVSATLVALTIGLSACGGASQPLTAAAFRTQADAVCRDVTRRVDALARDAAGGPQQAALRRAAAVMDDAVARLEAIDPPPALADRYDAFKAWTRTRRDAALKLADGNSLSARQQVALRAHDNGGTTVAKQLGLADCH